MRKKQELRARRKSRAVEPPARKNALLYAGTLFLSAFLLFQVELIAGKVLLPWFGGSAAVWTTCLLFFQLLLLAGYAYAHLLSTRLRISAQVIVHFVLLVLAALQVLAVWLFGRGETGFAANWILGVGRHPVIALLTVLLLLIGPPFFVLSSTGPLLQRWLVQMGAGVDVYRFYAVSNIGSLLGLLSFPFLIEPALGVRDQMQLWCLLFGLFVVLSGVGMASLRTMTGQLVSESGVNSGVRWQEHSFWFVLAACASGLLLATTNLLCQEVTSLPLLWVAPLALYLLTFILCFDHPRWYNRAIVHPLYAAALILTSLALEARNFRLELLLLPLSLFLSCMVCHGELARRKPAASNLTTFYLTICAGGAAGGLFVAVVAPQIFSFFTELQLLLAASAFLLLAALFIDKESWLYNRKLWLPAAITVGALVTAFVGGRKIGGVSSLLGDFHYYPVVGAAVLLACAGAYASPWIIRRPRFNSVQFLAIILSLLVSAILYRSTRPESAIVAATRNFYGAIRVARGPQGAMKLEHGQTTHGYQMPTPNDRVPTTYYGPDSTIGIVLRNHPKRSAGSGNLRVGVIGLGAGTLASYGRPGDYFRFYEINPAIVNVAAGTQAPFTYIRDSSAKVEMETGDARLLLDRELASGHPQNFDVLVLDAFSGDAIPVHLLTKEAFELYFRHLAPDGIIAVHMSSRHVDLEPVLHGIVEEFPEIEGRATFTIEKPPFKSSLWMLLSGRHEMLTIQGLNQIGQYQPSGEPPVLWTDDHTSVLPLLRR